MAHIVLLLPKGSALLKCQDNVSNSWLERNDLVVPVQVLMVTSLSLKTLPHSSMLGRCLLGNGYVTCTLLISWSRTFRSPCSKVDKPSFVNISCVCSRGNHMRWQWHKSVARFLIRLFLWWYLKCTSYFSLIRNWCLLILAAFARKINKQYYFNWCGGSHHGTWSHLEYFSSFSSHLPDHPSQYEANWRELISPAMLE